MSKRRQKGGSARPGGRDAVVAAWSTKRDPGRIDPILEKLAHAWAHAPDLRLGQLLVNLTGRQEPFYVEDDQLEASLDAFIAGGGMPLENANCRHELHIFRNNRQRAVTLGAMDIPSARLALERADALVEKAGPVPNDDPGESWELTIFEAAGLADEACWIAARAAPPPPARNREKGRP